MAKRQRPGTCAARDCERAEEIAIRTTNSDKRDGLIHTIYGVASDAPATVPGYCAEHGAHLAANLALVHTGKTAMVGVQ